MKFPGVDQHIAIDIPQMEQIFNRFILFYTFFSSIFQVPIEYFFINIVFAFVKP